MNQIGAVVVTYNPSEKTSTLLSIISKTVSEVVVIDNGSSNPPKYEGHNVSIVYNAKNLGLATALNQGCEILLSHGNSYCFTFDQDSEIDIKSIESIIDTMDKLNAAVVSPRILLKSKTGIIEGKYITGNGVFIRRKRIDVSSNLKVLVNITSGSLINLYIWDSLGRFWDDLFIEGIDNEFGLRLNKIGYSIYICSSAVLYQQLGNYSKDVIKLGIKFHPTNHSGKRYWYQYRNAVLIMRKLGFFRFLGYHLYIILAFTKKYFTVLLADTDGKEKCKSIRLGIAEGFKHKPVGGK